MPKLTMHAGNVKSLKPKDKTIEYFDTSGNDVVTGQLGLRVSPKGKKTWFILYRANEKKRRFTIGDYPAITLSQARKKANEELVKINKGNYDPMALKTSTRQAPTMTDLFDHYFDTYVVKKGKAAGSIKEDNRQWETLKGKIKEKTGVTGWTAHDLRQTARTIMARENVPSHIAERVINHKQGRMEAVYDQYGYIDEKAGALNKLAAAIDRISGISNKKARVIRLRRIG